MAENTFKVDISLVEKWQRENNVVQEPGSREAAMVIIRHDENGRPTVWCDPEIADLVAALNTDSLSTVASCSGHGYRPGSILLKDGRRLLVFDNEADYERAEGVFPLDINGHPVTRDDARHDGEWPEGVDRVCIGVITHAAAAKGSESEGFDYEMVPVAASPAAPVSEGVELLCRERAELAAKLIAGADWQEHGIHPKGPLFGAKDMRRAAALLLDGREWNEVPA